MSHTSAPASAPLHHLAAAAVAISRARSLDQLVRVITVQARTIVGAHQAVTSLLLDRHGAPASRPQSFADGEVPADSCPIPTHAAAIAATLHGIGNAMQLDQDQIAAHLAWAGDSEAHARLPRSWLAAPLVGPDGRSIGLIQLADKAAGPFTADDEAIVVQLAQMAGIAIEHIWVLEQLAAEHARLEAVLQQLPAGVIIADARSQRVISSNTQAETILGTTLRDADTLGAYFAVQKYHPDGRPYHMTERPLARALHQGEVVSDEQLVVRRQDGSAVMARVSAAPIRDEAGQIMAAVATIADVTGMQRMIDAQRFLAEAGALLASSLDPGATLRHLAELAVPRLTDLCVVDLLAADGRLQRALARANPPHTAAARALAALQPQLDPDRVARLQAGQAQQLPLVPPAALAALPGDTVATSPLGELGQVPALVVPLVVRGQLLGLLSCARLHGGTHDLALIGELAQRAAVAIEAARLYETARVSEDRLRSSEQMFRTLAETVAAATFIFQGPRMRYVNTAAERLTGYTRDELLAMPFSALFAPADALALTDQWPADAPQAPRELRIRTRDGAERWVQLTLGAMQFAGGPATVSTAFDITERKLAERILAEERSNMEQTVRQRTHELQRERDRTQAILEALGEAVIVTDEQGLIEYINPAAVALTGWSATTALHQHWQPLGLALGAAARPFWEAIRTGQTWRGEVSQPRADGQTVETALTVAPLFTEPGRTRPGGFVGVQRDITPLKAAERLKDQFISNVSHELRTPLSVITLFSGNLEHSYELLDTAQRRRFIRGIWEQTQVLDNLINGVLEIARIDGRRVAAERTTIELDGLVRAIAAQQRPLAHAQGLRMRLRGGPLHVQGNAGQLRQVLQNLLSNAIKYTAAGGRISCTWRTLALPAEARRASKQWPGSADLPAGRWAALKVADTGIGIAAAHQARIFERFYRVKAQGRVPGTGLGLAIVQELVQLHGGRIALASTPDRGSSFVLYLPLGPAE